MALWADPAYVRPLWADAPKLDSTLLAVLNAAHGQLVEYAPALALDTTVEPPVEIVPDHYRYAELLQARALWAATRRDGDVLGFDGGEAIRVRPLDSTVKALLRPGAGIGRVG